jgi:hypothetical protein
MGRDSSAFDGCGVVLTAFLGYELGKDGLGASSRATSELYLD